MDKKILEKRDRFVGNIIKGVTAAATAVEVFAMQAMTAFASNIDTNFKISDSVGSMDPEGLIIGLAIWICRLIGIGMLIWGIYGYVTARKDGEAESMNGALGKLISGLVLICMPTVLRGLGIIG